MTAETLRRAASLMRERAEGATEGPWFLSIAADGGPQVHSEALLAAGAEFTDVTAPAVANGDAAHIASWHPAVALAVAKAMDDCAQAWEICDDGWTRDVDDDAIRFEDTVDGGWLNVARAYLGEPA